mgnify:CR=1 FL=1
MVEKNTYCEGECPPKSACDQCYPKPKIDEPTKSVHQKAANIAFELLKEAPCSFRGCGAMSGEGPEGCIAGETPNTCSKRRASTKFGGKGGGKGRNKSRKLSRLDMEVRTED